MDRVGFRDRDKTIFFGEECCSNYKKSVFMFS